MNTGRVSTILGVALLLSTGCGDSTGPQESPLVIEILDTKTSAPAKVTVTFQVTTEAGDPVPSLPVTAFELFDNGVSDSQFESSKAFQPKPGRFQSSVALLLDMSGSITGTAAFEPLKDAAGAFVDNALDAQGVVVGVWWFDGGSDIVQLMDFTDDATALKTAIDGLTSDVTRDNSTNLNGAVQLGIEVVESQLENGGLPGEFQAGALVVFTDGTDQANRVPAAAALAAVAGTDIAIYTIGLRGEIDESFLSQIGRSGTVFADGSSALLGQFANVGDRIEALANSFYVLAYCSPRRGGVNNQLSIRVSVGERRATAQTQYAAVNFTGGCTI